MSEDIIAQLLARNAQQAAITAQDSATAKAGEAAASASAAAGSASAAGGSATSASSSATAAAGSATAASSSAAAASASAGSAATQAGVATAQANASALSASAAQAAAASVGYLNAVVSQGGTPPYTVTGITAGSAGSGATVSGEFDLVVSGGPAGHKARVIVSGGAITGYRIVAGGLSTSNAAPTYTLPSIAGLTGATAPTATVGALANGQSFTALSADNLKQLLWQITSNVIAPVNDGTGAQQAFPLNNQVAANTSAVNAVAAKFRQFVNTAASLVPLITGNLRHILSINRADGAPYWMGSPWPVATFGGVRDAVNKFRRQTAADNGTLIAVNRRQVFSLDTTTFAPNWMGGRWPMRIPGTSLSQWFAKAATIKSGGSAKLKLMMLGDSYCELTTIPQVMANQIRAVYGDCGGGWIAVQGVGPLDTATFSTSAGWTVFDAGTGSAILPLPSVGVSHDGKVIYTTLTTQTATWTFTGTEFRLYYGKQAGAFRYQVDGGSWTTVTPDGTGALGILTLSGLSSGAHTINLDTSVNTGTVALYGTYFTNTSATGVEVLKCGNGSLHAGHLATYVNTYVAGLVADLAPDVIVVILGTNDYASNNSSPALMASVYGQLVTAIRAVLPNVGFIFVTPPDTNLTVQSAPLVQYDTAVGVFARQNGHEFYSIYQDFASWAVENARGMFSGDIRHMNSTAAYRPVSRLVNHYLTL